MQTRCLLIAATRVVLPRERRNGADDEARLAPPPPGRRSRVRADHRRPQAPARAADRRLDLDRLHAPGARAAQGQGQRPPPRRPTAGRPRCGLENIDKWLGDGKWDVIHFNFGLHDLKYVDDAGKNTSPTRATSRSRRAVREEPPAARRADEEDRREADLRHDHARPRRRAAARPRRRGEVQRDRPPGDEEARRADRRPSRLLPSRAERRSNCRPTCTSRTPARRRWARKWRSRSRRRMPK